MIGVSKRFYIPKPRRRKEVKSDSLEPVVHFSIDPSEAQIVGVAMTGGGLRTGPGMVAFNPPVLEEVHDSNSLRGFQELNSPVIVMDCAPEVAPKVLWANMAAKDLFGCVSVEAIREVKMYSLTDGQSMKCQGMIKKQVLQRLLTTSHHSEPYNGNQPLFTTLLTEHILCICRCKKHVLNCRWTRASDHLETQSS